MFDSHIHSTFSADSNILAEDAIKIAIKNKLKGIAFTEHIDFEMPGNEDVELLDTLEYYKKLSELKIKYKEKCIVSIGLEIGQTPGTYVQNKSIINENNYDYILSSIHVVNGIDTYHSDFFEGKTKKKAYEEYLEAVYNTINDFTDFDMLAHMDYVSRRAPYKDIRMYYTDLKDYFDEIFKKLASTGKGFEINTGIDKYLPVESMCDINIIKRYKELGGEFICLGSDAHDENRIGSSFDHCHELLSMCGFKYITYFLNRKKCYLKI